MKNLLGIGPAGCQIVQQLNKNKNYQVYQVLPSPKRTTKYRFSLPLLQGPEEYEDMKYTSINNIVIMILIFYMYKSKYDIIDLLKNKVN